MDEPQSNIPRWATEFGEETWKQINELVDQGWGAIDIARKLQVTSNKMRSLQVYIQKHGPRRRLVKFAQFKDALVQQIETFGEEMVKALSVIAARAISNDTKPGTQVRAFEAMTQFTRVLQQMMGEDSKAEEERKREDGEKKSYDPDAMLRTLLERYHEPGKGGDADG